MILNNIFVIGLPQLNYYRLNIQLIIHFWFLFILKVSPFTPWVWAIYCTTIALLFIIIKLLNHTLHELFDKNDGKLDKKNEDDSQIEMKKLKETTYDKTRDNILWVEFKYLYKKIICIILNIILYSDTSFCSQYLEVFYDPIE